MFLYLIQNGPMIWAAQTVQLREAAEGQTPTWSWNRGNSTGEQCVLERPFIWCVKICVFIYIYLYIQCIRRDEKNYIKHTLRVSTMQNISKLHVIYTQLNCKRDWYTHHIEYNVLQPSQFFCPPYVHQTLNRPSARSCPTYVIAEVVLWQVHAFQLNGFEGNKSHSFPSKPGQQKTNCQAYPLAN